MNETSALKPTALVIDDEVQIRRHILREVWGPNSVEQTHFLRVYIAHLREKLESEPSQPRLIVTEPGVGYRLREET